jgi:hypothetical protein
MTSQYDVTAARLRARGDATAVALLRASRSMLPLTVMALVVVARLGHAYDAVQIPIRPSILPTIPLLRVPAGGSASVIMRPAEVSVSRDTVCKVAHCNIKRTACPAGCRFGAALRMRTGRPDQR